MCKMEEKAEQNKGNEMEKVKESLKRIKHIY